MLVLIMSLSEFIYEFCVLLILYYVCAFAKDENKHLYLTIITINKDAPGPKKAPPSVRLLTRGT